MLEFEGIFGVSRPLRGGGENPGREERRIRGERSGGGDEGRYGGGGWIGGRYGGEGRYGEIRKSGGDSDGGHQCEKTWAKKLVRQKMGDGDHGAVSFS